TGTRLGFLGPFDGPPVVEVRRLDATLLQQRIQPFTARLAAVRSGRHRGGDLLGDLVTVRPVGADRPGRSAPRPADAIETLTNLAMVIQIMAVLVVIGHAGQRRRRI